MEFSTNTVHCSNLGGSILGVPNDGRSLRLTVPNLFTCICQLEPEIVKMQALCYPYIQKESVEKYMVIKYL